MHRNDQRIPQTLRECCLGLAWHSNRMAGCCVLLLGSVSEAMDETGYSLMCPNATDWGRTCRFRLTCLGSCHQPPRGWGKAVLCLHFPTSVRCTWPLLFATIASAVPREDGSLLPMMLGYCCVGCFVESAALPHIWKDPFSLIMHQGLKALVHY